MKRPLAGVVRRIVISLAVLLPSFPVFGEPLTLEAAESLAVARDAGAAGLEERSAALSESAVAEAQLPDPELRFGALNLPVDSFALDDEPMTQLLVGVRQRFPRGETRALKQAQAQSMSAVESAMARERKREVIRALRQAWIERGYTEEAMTIVQQQQSWFLQLEEAATAAYAAGGRRQNDLFRIAMERELLEEDAVRLRQMARTWDAELGRWLGAEADRATIERVPELPSPPPRERALEALVDHPALSAEIRRVDAGRLGVELAKQQYRPSWALDLSYGVRDGSDPSGDDRPDFFSAMISFELPIFPRERQDRRVAAAVAGELEMKSRLQDRQREIRRRFETAWANYESLGRRADLFEGRVLPSAVANVEATRLAYQNDVVLFDELVRAEKSLLDARMRLLRLRADRIVTAAELHYLTGDNR
jgi:outer membrane protein TolC